MFYSLFGFWMFSNKHAFENVILTRAINDLVSDHGILESLMRISPGYPLLIAIVLDLILSFSPEKYLDIIWGCPKLDKLRGFHMEQSFYSSLIPKSKAQLEEIENFLKDHGMEQMSKQ